MEKPYDKCINFSSRYVFLKFIFHGYLHYAENLKSTKPCALDFKFVASLLGILKKTSNDFENVDFWPLYGWKTAQIAATLDFW